MVFNEENILLVLTYLLPGFIITKIVTTELLLDNRSTANDIYKYLLYSVVNLVVYSSIDWIFITSIRNPLTYNEIITIFLRNLLTPVLIGFLISIIMKKSQEFNSRNPESQSYKTKNLWYFLDRLFTLLELNRKSQIDDAWDWVFYNLYLMREKRTEIVIILNDRTEIRGLFGKQSFASYNKAGNRCIFIEEEFPIPPDLIRAQKGRFINEKDIQSIQIPSRSITAKK